MLSKRTKYAIHALIHLAKKKDQGPVQIRTIAESENIPKKFLEGILLDLRNAGIVRSVKGREGGYVLNKDPDEVSLAHVVRFFDGAIGLLPCVTFVYYQKCDECSDEEICGLRSVLKEVRDETVMMLKSATLSAIIKREQKLADSKQKRLSKKKLNITQK